MGRQSCNCYVVVKSNKRAKTGIEALERRIQSIVFDQMVTERNRAVDPARPLIGSR